MALSKSTCRRRVVRVLGTEPAWWDGYSPKESIGKAADVAFASPVDPTSELGARLKALGLRSAFLGRGFVYYTA